MYICSEIPIQKNLYMFRNNYIVISRVDFYKLFWERFKQNDIKMSVWLSDADIDKIKVINFN